LWKNNFMEHHSKSQEENQLTAQQHQTIAMKLRQYQK